MGRRSLAFRPQDGVVCRTALTIDSDGGSSRRYVGGCGVTEALRTGLSADVGVHILLMYGFTSVGASTCGMLYGECFHWSSKLGSHYHLVSKVLH